MRKPRRAKLEICGLSESGWLRLTARNGEKLMHGERVDKPRRARAAIIRAMVDVLTDEGLVVLLRDECDELMESCRNRGANDLITSGKVIPLEEPLKREATR